MRDQHCFEHILVNMGLHLIQKVMQCKANEEMQSAILRELRVKLIGLNLREGSQFLNQSFVLLAHTKEFNQSPVKGRLCINSFKE